MSREPVKPYVPPPPPDNGIGANANAHMAQMGKWHLNRTQSIESFGRANDLWIGRALLGIGVGGIAIVLLVKAWLG